MIVAAVTTSARAAAAPGNVALGAAAGLDRDYTVNVSQLLTLDRAVLEEPVAQLDLGTIRRVDEGLRLVLSLA